GLAAIITPMNFIWGIPMIHLAGAYLTGCPWIFKGHPFAGATNTSMVRCFLAAGADPRFIQKVEGFGKGIAPLATDHRVAVVAVTGSSDTARAISSGRGLARTRFEGGGCNWAWVDDGYDDGELEKIAERLAYAKLGLSSHKCTGLQGVSASRATLDRLVPMIAAEMDRWQVMDPRSPDATDKTLGPLMVHKAQTALDVVAEARKAGLRIVREGGRAGGDYGANAEAVKPALIDGVTPQTTLRHDWDGKGVREYRIATTELFMPILVAMPLKSFEDFVRFSLFDNPHDLATSIWTRDDRKLTRARRTLAGMLKENDGTDSALEWEEFGASTVGESGNMGVGEVQATEGMRCVRQNGPLGVENDLFRAADFLFPEGLDHHHLLVRSRLLGRVALEVARRLAGLGELPGEARSAVRGELRTVKLAIVGGGPAGLSAARMAAAGTLLIERERRVGGAPLLFGDTINPDAGRAEVLLQAECVGLYANDTSLPGDGLLAVRHRDRLSAVIADRVI